MEIRKRVEVTDEEKAWFAKGIEIADDYRRSDECQGECEYCYFRLFCGAMSAEEAIARMGENW